MYLLSRAQANPLNLNIQMSKSGTKKVVHHNKLNRYAGDNPPNWVVKLSKKVILGRTAWEYINAVTFFFGGGGGGKPNFFQHVR